MHDPWTSTKGGIAVGKGGAGWRRAKGGNWDKCNSIINKIYLKNSRGISIISHVTGKGML